MAAKSRLRELTSNISSVFLIHYSCQDLSDANEGYSPRITSIAVLHADSQTMHSFSIHLVAEKRKVDRSSIEAHYDELEAEMLERFFGFVSSNPEARWVHWNMSNINFGFDTLSHRYEVLTGETAPRIQDSRRYNLSSLIMAKYGSNCVDHPKMPNLMEVNGGKHRDVLSGQEEAEAFKAKEFLKLHKSTMSKVYWFRSIFYKLIAGKVKTQRSNWSSKLNRALESLPAKILGFAAVLITIAQLAYIAIRPALK